MHDIITKTGLFSLRNMVSYRIIGSTIADKLGKHVLDLEFIVKSFRNSGNLHCISCITYDFISTAILAYAISFHFSGEGDTIKRLDRIKPLGSSKLRKFVEKTIWIILYILTKNMENAI